MDVEHDALADAELFRQTLKGGEVVAMTPQMESHCRDAIAQLRHRPDQQVDAEPLDHGAVIHEVEPRRIGNMAIRRMGAEYSRVRDVHRDEGLGVRDASGHQRRALRMIDANDLVGDRGAHLLFEAEHPVHERSLGKLRRKGLRHRVVNVEHDLATRQSRQQSRKDQEIGKVVDMNDIELADNQQAQA